MKKYLLYTGASILAIIAILTVILLSAVMLDAAEPPPVTFNEIAWMGMTTSYNHEWIELKNNSDATIDLTGWILKTQDGGIDIILDGKINPHGFFLITKNVIPVVTPNQTTKGTLANSGEILMLVNSSGVIMDTISKWYAGNNTKKATMERTSSNLPGDNDISWANATTPYDGGFGTPNAENSVLLVEKEGTSDSGYDTPYTGIGNKTITSFNIAKSRLYLVHEFWKTTIYCHCNYTDLHTIDLAGCKTKYRLNETRQNRIEAEHVVPANKMLGRLPEWIDKNNSNPGCIERGGSYRYGRSCAEHYHITGNRAHNDIHNLWPALGEVNGDRSNHPFTENLEGEPRLYGECDFEVGYDTDDVKKAEPPADVARGYIARTQLYMQEAYSEALGYSIFNNIELALAMRWNEEYPVTDNECKRNELIYAIQGNYNHYTKRLCDKETK